MPLAKSFFLILASLMLSACVSAPNLWGAPPPFLATDTPTSTFTPTLTPTATLTFTPEPTLTPAPTSTFTLTPTALSPADKIEHVIVITFDGMRADAVEAAPMTNLLAMINEGASTLTARTINYAVTLPGHASLFSGLCQSKHGVDWDTTKYYRGYAKGADVFDLAHAAGLKTVMIVNKEKMRQLAEPETTDVYQLVYATEATIMQTAIEQIPQGFNLMFIHFGSPDNRGHKYGWMSNSYLKALRDGDATLPALLAALDEYGIRNSTLILVTADHGGHERTHVGDRLYDLEIPWVAYGAGVAHTQIQNPVSIMDSAPSIAYALNLPAQADWDGIPVYEAFGLPVEKTHPEDFRICK